MPRTRMTSRIAMTARLDDIAGELEAVDPRLALALDRVSDSLEKIAAGSTLRAGDFYIVDGKNRFAQLGHSKSNVAVGSVLEVLHDGSDTTKGNNIKVYNAPSSTGVHQPEQYIAMNDQELDDAVRKSTLISISKQQFESTKRLWAEANKNHAWQYPATFKEYLELIK